MAARTIAVLSPESASFPSSNYAPLGLVNARLVLMFDASTDETAYWTFVAIQGITTPLTLVIQFIMASATSGNILMSCAVEAVTPADATDLDATTSFDTTNTSSATAVPGTAGYLGSVSITLTNNDSIAAGDYVRLSVSRAASNVSDTATCDLYLLMAELRDDGN